MSYEFNCQDVLDFTRTFTSEAHVKGDEVFFKYCPYCNGGKKDKNTFSINIENGVFKCFRSSCGKQGHFVELARDFNYKLDFKDNINSKVYRELPQNKIKTKLAAVLYMEKRGISQSITEKYNITTQKENDNILVFPFYDENNKLVFIKYRHCNPIENQSKEWCEKNTKPILFGINHCNGFDRLIITEGQIDSLTLAECGVKNAVSVPTGAMGFTWVDYNWDWIIQFDEIVVMGDNEGSKITLLDTLQKRLPNIIKAVQIEDYLGEKDANDIFIKYGKQAILRAINNAKVPPLKNVKELSDVENVDIYNLPRIYTNIYDVDKIIGGLFFGQVILLTGKRGEGKSTFMSQLMVDAVEQNYGVFAYSGELIDYHFKRWFDLQAAGQHNLTIRKNEWGDESFYLEQKIIDKLNNWYRGKVYIYDNNSIDCDDEFESILATIEKSICRYGVKLICIDNLMTALDININDDLYRAQSLFVRKLKMIAVKYNVVVLLVAHPRKSSATFENDDVSGSGDITNRVDVVMSYSRSLDNNGELRISKNRLLGTLVTKNDFIKLLYSKSTKRISTIQDGLKKYSWEKDPQYNQRTMLDNFTEVTDKENKELPW